MGRDFRFFVSSLSLWLCVLSLVFRYRRRGFARLLLRCDVPVVVSRVFWPAVASSIWAGRNGARGGFSRENSLAFRPCRCGFAQILLCCVSRHPAWFRANSVSFWLLLGGRLGCGPPRRARWVGREQCGFARISAVSREFPCVSTLPVWFRANCLAFRRSRYDFA